MTKVSEFILLLSQHCFLDLVFLDNFSLESYTTEISAVSKPCTFAKSKAEWPAPTAEKSLFHFSRLTLSSCSASVISFNASSQSHHLQVLNHLQSNRVLQRHPDYVVLVSELKMSYNLPVIFKFIHSFEQYGLVEIDIATQRARSTLEIVDRMWWNLHKNMSESKVFTRRRALWNFLGYFSANCTHLGYDFEGDARVCILQLLSQLLNFDFVHKECANVNFEVKKIYTELVSKSTYEETSNTATTIDNWQATTLYREYDAEKSTKMIWIPWGWMKDPLSFIMIFNKSSLRQTALLRPFDSITWLLLLISVALMSSMLILSLGTYRAFYLRKKPAMGSLMWINAVLMTLGAIMEQNPSELTAKKKILSFRILFQIWLLVSIIVTNAYTGIVISFLCSDVLPPNLPKDLKELVQNFELKKFPLISVDTIEIPEHNLTLHYSSAFIREYIGILEAYQGPNSYKPHYKRINSETIYLDIVNKKLPVVYERRFKIPGHITSLKKDFHLPLQFSFISTKAGINILGNLMKNNPDVMTWMPASDESEQKENVYALTSFTVPRNFFYRLVNRYLAWIVEGGLPNIWKVKGDELVRKWNQKDMECWRRKTNQSMFWEYSNCIKTTSTKTGAVHHQQHDEDSQPLQLQSLYMIFIICLIGLGCSLITFNFEICCGGMWRRLKLWYWIFQELNSSRTQNLRPLCTVRALH